MNEIYAKKIKEYLPKIYKTYLLRLIDAGQIDQMFSQPEIAKAFKNVIDLVYDGNTFGNKYDDKIKLALHNYEKTVQDVIGFNDEYLRQFLHIYRFYTSCTISGIVTKDNVYVAQEESSYFKKLSYTCCEACENLFTDLQNGNRWWEANNATTLRRQLVNDRVVLPIERIQKLCKKYLGREIDLNKDLQLNENKSTPPLELVKELDTNMSKKGYDLVYSWVDVENGDYKIVQSKTKPLDGRYYYKKYVKVREEIKEN